MSYWARAADSSLWHSCRGPQDSSERRPTCGALPWPRQPDDAVRGPMEGGVFGPVCGACSARQGVS